MCIRDRYTLENERIDTSLSKGVEHVDQLSLEPERARGPLIPVRDVWIYISGRIIRTRSGRSTLRTYHARPLTVARERQSTNRDSMRTA